MTFTHITLHQLHYNIYYLKRRKQFTKRLNDNSLDFTLEKHCVHSSNFEKVQQLFTINGFVLVLEKVIIADKSFKVVAGTVEG